MPGWRAHACALLLYAVLALAFTWPLPLHLSTHLTGPIDGDTGVYVWNQWVFRHELIEHRSLPFFTGEIFSPTSRANLSLHNYTTFANLMALPLTPHFGVVATFNIVLLALVVLAAYAMFLLARHVAGGAGVEAILAGVLFAWSPVLVTRGGGHFSLVAAAPLPIFVLALIRAERHWRARDAVVLGIVMAWAATSDVYYAVFCLLLAVVFLAAHLVRVDRSEPARVLAVASRATEILMVAVGGLIVALAIGRGWRFTFQGGIVSLRGLYTPVLVLTLLAGVRAILWYRPTVSIDREQVRGALRTCAVMTVAAFVFLSPVLYALGHRVMEHGLAGAIVFWRSSPPGVDLAAFLLPNPNHPLASPAIREWLTPRPDAYLESVASVPFVAIAMLWLSRRAGWRAPRLWVGVTLFFGLLALGPFIHLAGVNTYVPGPWAVLRYVPVVGLVRTPARFSVVLMLGIATLFALALRAMTERYPRHRAWLLAGVAVLLLAELLPVPRPLYDASIPSFYDIVAADPREHVRVLELPLGIRDGTTSIGNFTARSQYYQTKHQKPIIGGYLSRVSRKRLRDMERLPVRGALITLSDNRDLPPKGAERLRQLGPDFIRRANVGYVVIDRRRASETLVRLAIAAFHLEPVARDGALELYRPVL